MVRLYKDVILLTTSKKVGNYCIAGIENRTGRWVRIISEDDEIQHAVKLNDMICEDGSIPQVLDIVRIKCKGYSPNFYQTENYVLDNSTRWKILERARMKDVLAIHPSENKPYIFYDNEKSVDSNYFRSLDDKDKYSLTLISPEDICVHVKQWSKKKTDHNEF